MKSQLRKVYPLLVIGGVAGLLLWTMAHDAANPRSPSFFQWLEWKSHDWRVKLAFRQPGPTAATNLAVLLIDDETLRVLPLMFTNDAPRWPFSHFYHGLLIEELKQQGASVVGFDVFFAYRDDRQQFSVYRGSTEIRMTGQQFFAGKLRTSGNVILCAGADRLGGVAVRLPVMQLATNALAVGTVTATGDEDGTFRRLRPFEDHPQLGRHWTLGFVMAAHQLGLDLKRAEITPERIVVPGTNGVSREVPLTPSGHIYFDWSVYPGSRTPAARRVQLVKFEQVLMSARQRALTQQPYDLGLTNRLVVVGAGGSGVNVYDRGPTSLGGVSLLCMGHVNSAHGMLTGQFVQRLAPLQERVIVIVLVMVATLASWHLRMRWASLIILVVAGAYAGLAAWLYVNHRYLLPLALPLVGALMTTFLVMLLCRGVENADRRHLERLLNKVVSPKIIHTLLQQDSPAPQTGRTEITVFFADLRGFTRFSEESQTRAETAALALGLSSDEAQTFADKAAREAMTSVNRYLAAVVDEIKATDGTLDKYMGDCVMAFWGAPVADPNHAAQALKCALATARSLERLHREFAMENQRREQENQERLTRRQPPLPLLPVLRLGIGLNSGLATVGFMGSEKHLSSYTAFGHVVNVASRVEGLASGGQIIATEQTVVIAGRNHPELLARCTELPPVLLKGISSPVKVFEVQWREPETPPVMPPPA